MKCTCKSTTHGHKAGECKKEAAKSGMCKSTRSRTESETVKGQATTKGRALLRARPSVC